jgi:hypothetical protein
MAMKYLKSGILVVVCLLLACSDYAGEVLIVNMATEPVSNGTLEVCDQKFQFGGIELGKSKTIQYEVRSDSHFKLVLEFNSGKKLVKEVGYVTSGQDFKHILTLNDHDVSVKLL